jgi:hypothetical protein
MILNKIILSLLALTGLASSYLIASEPLAVVIEEIEQYQNLAESKAFMQLKNLQASDLQKKIALAFAVHDAAKETNTKASRFTVATYRKNQIVKIVVSLPFIVLGGYCARQLYSGCTQTGIGRLVRGLGSVIGLSQIIPTLASFVALCRASHVVNTRKTTAAKNLTKTEQLLNAVLS